MVLGPRQADPLANARDSARAESGLSIAQPMQLLRRKKMAGMQPGRGAPPVYGKANTTIVDEPGAARQKLLAAPDATATYCLPPTV